MTRCISFVQQNAAKTSFRSISASDLCKAHARQEKRVCVWLHEMPQARETQDEYDGFFLIAANRLPETLDRRRRQGGSSQLPLNQISPHSCRTEPLLPRKTV